MSDPRFGGDWTERKLSILENYLNAYTTALKDKPRINNPFRLIYIDAFAGSGKVEVNRSEADVNGEIISFLEGSAVRAIRVTDKPFDELIFVEQNRTRYSQLKRRLESDYADRNLKFRNEDANEFLLRLERNWRICRGVLFLDPFGTQIEFRTIQKVASLNALDTWILVPVSAIARLLPKGKDPRAISQGNSNRLNRIYGDESWRDGLYRVSSQGELFGRRPWIRDPGIEGLWGIYEQKLKEAFGNRLLGESLTLKNSKNPPMYKLIFCCGSPSSKAIGVSKRIAGHLIQEMQGNG